MPQLKFDSIFGVKREANGQETKTVTINGKQNGDMYKMIVDVHEDPIIIEKLRKEKGIFVEVRHLESGDYVFGNVGVERKTIQDFYNSIVSGDKHIWKQVFNLKYVFERPVLIIERWDDDFLHKPGREPTVRGAIARIILLGVTVLVIPGRGRDVQPFVDTLAYMYFSSEHKSVSMRPLPAKSKERTRKSIISDMLAMIPGIGRAFADKIAEHVDSIEEACDIKDEELTNMLPRFGYKRLAIYRWVMNKRALPKELRSEENGEERCLDVH